MADTNTTEVTTEEVTQEVTGETVIAELEEYISEATKAEMAMGARMVARFEMEQAAALEQSA